MDDNPTIPTDDLLLKACAERCRKGTCDMSCAATGKTWCEPVRAEAGDGDANGG